MRRFLLAGVAMAALSVPAFAADVLPLAPTSPPAAAPAAAFNWTGPYLGVFGGYGFGYSGATTTTPTGFLNGFDENTTGLTLPVSPRGLLGGVALGYNFQAGALLLGLEADAGFLGLNGTNTQNGGLAIGAPNGLLDDDMGTVNYGWYATLGARLGVALDRTLLFATAGGVITQYAGTYGDLDGASPGTLDPGDATTLAGPQFGYLLGGGAEFTFDANWTARLEYNYLNLGTDTTGNTDGDTFTHRNNAHLIKFGLNYLFGN